MFRELRRAQPNCATIRVGDDTTAPNTAAEFAVPDPDAMRVLLEHILSLRRGQQRSS
jgi:hypothetical protein